MRELAEVMLTTASLASNAAGLDFVSGRADTATVQNNQVPVLRWVFVRHAERLQCELSLGDSHLLYEVRTRRLGVSASEAIEHYPDSSQAFHRQSDLERGWLEDGWSMEHFEKRHVERH